MTEEQEAPAAEAEPTAAPEGEGEQQQPDPKVEARARDMGWVPKDRYKGDPEKWRSAEEYVRRGEEVLPIVAAEKRRLEQQLTETKAEFKETLARVERMNQKALERQRLQIEQQFEGVKTAYVETGNVKGYNDAERAKKQALKDFDEAVADKEDDKAKPNGKANGADGLNQRDRGELKDWVDSNPWYNRSPKLHGAADEHFDDVSREMPYASMAEKLAEVSKRVEDEFPSLFGKKGSGGTRHAAVEGSGGRGPEGGDGGGEYWAKVPAAVKATAKQHIEEERLFDALVGAERGKPLTPAQLRQAREAWAKDFLS